MTKARRFCIFCGERANSREHLFPEWLQRLFPADEMAVHFCQVNGEERCWEKRRFSEKTRRVCRDCNVGWMSRLEEAAKLVLAPAVTRSKLCAFDLRSQWIAAQWAVKTGYVFQTLGPQMLAPVMNPVLLRMNGMPPPEVSVFIGSHYRALSDPANSVYLQKPIELLIDDRDGQAADFGNMAFLAIGGVSFLLVEHQISRYVELVVGEMFSGLFKKIWPWTSKVVNWPPEMLMDRELVEPFFMDFQPSTLDVRIFDLPVHAEMAARAEGRQAG